MNIVTGEDTTSFSLNIHTEKDKMYTYTIPSLLLLLLLLLSKSEEVVALAAAPTRKTTVVAGATGYIGKSVVREAVRQGYRYVCVYLFMYHM